MIMVLCWFSVLHDSFRYTGNRTKTKPEPFRLFPRLPVKPPFVTDPEFVPSATLLPFSAPVRIMMGVFCIIATAVAVGMFCNKKRGPKAPRFRSEHYHTA